MVMEKKIRVCIYCSVQHVLYRFCLHEFRSDRLTKGHPAADNLRALLHIRDGSDGETPVRYGPPEMLNKQTNK